VLQVLTSGSESVLTLSEPVEFEEGEHYVVQLGDKLNQPQGIFNALPGERSNQIVISSTHGADIYTGFKRKRTGFQFGIAQRQNRRFVMRELAPSGEFQFTLTGEYDDPIVHTIDGLINDGTVLVPEPEDVFDKDLAQVRGLRIAFTGSLSVPFLNVTWHPVDHAERYVLQVSRDDGDTWNNLVSTSDVWYRVVFDLAVNRLRIAAMSDLVGPWLETEISLTDGDKETLRPNSPTGLELTEPFLGLSCKIKWDEQLDAKRWRISVCNSEGVAKRTIGVTNPEYSYTSDDAKGDGLGRDLLFKVWAENDTGDFSFEYAELSASNPQVGALNNIIGSDFIEHAQISAGVPSAVDFEGFIVWMSPEQNFEVNDSLVISEGSRGPVVSFPIPEEKMYAKIAAYDAWGKDNLTVSSEIVFTRPLIDNSKLAQDLRDEIDLIAVHAEQFTSVGEDILAVDQKIDTTKVQIEETTAETFSAIDSRIIETEEGIEAQSHSLEQLEVRIAGAEDDTEQLAIVSSEAEATANEALGTVNAQLTFKVAARGADGAYHLAGFGASATNESSRVLFFADKIGFMHPGAGSALALAVENGRTTIASASIGLASITTAHIESLEASKIDAANLSAITADLGTVVAGYIRSADGRNYWNLNTGAARFENVTINGHIEAATGTFVDTLNIAGHAVSYGIVGHTAQTYSLPPNNGARYKVLYGSIDLKAAPQSCLIDVGILSFVSGGSTNLTVSIRRNGTEIQRQSITHTGDHTQSNSFKFYDSYQGTGIRTYEVWVGNDWSGGGSVITKRVTSSVTANMR
jgi:hypothetical protein